MKNIIFHVPMKINEEYISGTMIRPKRMKEAFEKIGYKVYPIIGSSTERAKAVSEINNLINSGHKFEFLYSESANFPTILLDEDHIPRHPFLDFNFFRFIKAHKIPIGLFYRDIYWRFETYKKEVNFFKRCIVIPLFLYDLLKYKSLVDILFVPSNSFINYLPINFDIEKIYPLPPGCIIPQKQYFRREGRPFTILYVGNIALPEHDISMLFRIAKRLVVKNEEITFLISCPLNAWEEWASYYLSMVGGKMPLNIKLYHKKPDDIESLFFESDLFFIPINDEYSKIASHIKFYEAIGYGVPIIVAVNGDSELGNFVKREKVGWVVEYSEERVIQFLNYLLSNPQEVKVKKENVIRVREKHTWEERARLVAHLLTSEVYRE